MSKEHHRRGHISNSSSQSQIVPQEENRSQVFSSGGASLPRDVKYALSKAPEGTIIMQATNVDHVGSSLRTTGVLAVKENGHVSSFEYFSGGINRGSAPGTIEGSNAVDSRYHERVNPYKITGTSGRHQRDWGCRVVADLKGDEVGHRDGILMHMGSRSHISEGCICVDPKDKVAYEQLIDRSKGRTIYMVPSTTLGGFSHSNSRADFDHMFGRNSQREQVISRDDSGEKPHEKEKSGDAKARKLAEEFKARDKEKEHANEHKAPQSPTQVSRKHEADSDKSAPHNKVHGASIASKG